MKTLYITISVMLLVSCGIPKNANQPNRGDAKSPQIIGDTGVTIVSDTSSSDETGLAVNVGEKTIDISYNENGFSNIDGHGATLSNEDKAALKRAADVYAQSKDLHDESPIDEQITYKVLDYLSYAPAEYTFDSNRYTKQFALKNEGISCVKKGTTIKAEWNTQAASYISENIMVGAHWPNGYGCMGRCGADCGGWLPSSWTKDCMDHDACSARNSASGGASDPNCGDEYNEAADDWTFGVIAGCRG